MRPSTRLLQPAKSVAAKLVPTIVGQRAPCVMFPTVKITIELRANLPGAEAMATFRGAWL